jgi:nicotinamide phosphoribosyltransferase
MRNFKLSLIQRTDGYKPTHYPLLPDGTSNVYSYLEARGGKFQATVQFGLTSPCFTT